MILIIVALTILATFSLTFCVAQSAVLVYLWRERARAAGMIHTLNNNVLSLLIEKSFLIAKQQNSRPEMDNDTVH